MWRLADLVRLGVLEHHVTVDALHDAAFGNDLHDGFGRDFVVKILSAAFTEFASEEVEIVA